MKKKLPGILLLIAMPCTVLIFVKVEALVGSDIVALLASVLFFLLVFALCALVFNKPDPREMPMEHPVIRDSAPHVQDAAGSPKAGDASNVGNRAASKAGTNDAKKEG